ncbi:hypothetical protein C8F01DRAFT_1367293 [Mycena amicta]|nr:hypothetical protein C8F01DRAFT_1367293 [Mycena amicta]
MLTILNSAPHVTDLFLGFNAIFAQDSTVGLSQGLSLINPSRLIVREESGQGEQIDFQAPTCSRRGNTQVEFESSADYYCLDKKIIRVATVIASGNRLTTGAVTSLETARWSYRKFKNCPLRTIRIKNPIPIWQIPELTLMKEQLTTAGITLVYELS